MATLSKRRRPSVHRWVQPLWKYGAAPLELNQDNWCEHKCLRGSALLSVVIPGMSHLTTIFVCARTHKQPPEHFEPISGGHGGPQAVHSLPNLDTKRWAAETSFPKRNLKKNHVWLLSELYFANMFRLKRLWQPQRLRRLRGLAVLVLLSCPSVRPGGENLCPDPPVLGSEICAERMQPTKIHQLPLMDLPSWHKKKNKKQPRSFCSLKGGEVGGGNSKSKSLLVFFLSVSDYVNQVLVVQVPSHVWGKGSEHLLHLSSNERTHLNNKPAPQLLSGTHRNKRRGGCTSSLENRSACVVNICVTLSTNRRIRRNRRATV